jgi:hypothetical protein
MGCCSALRRKNPATEAMMRVLPMIASRKGAAVLALAVIVALLWVHNVSTTVTDEDRTYGGLMLAQAGYELAALKATDEMDFEAEVRSVLAVQDAVLKAAPENRGLPFESSREPKDIFERKYGLCYDRSRAIEKILSWLGFETRHVSVYSTAHSSLVHALFTPQVPSHAVSEVMTRKGWMVIDSNARWIGLDSDHNAISLDDIQDEGLKPWASEIRDPVDKIFGDRFVQIRGLYSRHGYFYPPFTPIPDFNFGQLLGNVTD